MSVMFRPGDLVRRKRGFENRRFDFGDATYRVSKVTRATPMFPSGLQLEGVDDTFDISKFELVGTAAMSPVKYAASAEWIQVNSKLDGLTQFIEDDPAFRKLPQCQQILVHAQFMGMRMYLDALGLRLRVGDLSDQTTTEPT